MKALRITPDPFHGDWNYAITPNDTHTRSKKTTNLRQKL